MRTSAEVLQIASQGPEPYLAVSATWPDINMQLAMTFSLDTLRAATGIGPMMSEIPLRGAVSQLIKHVGMQARATLKRDLPEASDAFVRLTTTRLSVRSALALLGFWYGSDLSLSDAIDLLTGGSNDSFKMLRETCPFVFPEWSYLGGPKDGDSEALWFPNEEQGQVTVNLSPLLVSAADVQSGADLLPPRVGRYRVVQAADVENRILRWIGEE